MELQQQKNEQTKGILVATAAYVIWGILPMYWKLLYQVPAGGILAHRVIWSLIFVILILFFTGNVNNSLQELRKLFSDKKQLIAIGMASLIISINWFTFIWAVGQNHVVETSLGYYINPLISVLLGMMFFKEKLTKWQVVSFLVATLGVLVLIVQYGTVPYVAFILAISFGLYGLFKKLVTLGAVIGLAIETLFITPFALFYLFAFPNQLGPLLGMETIPSALMLIGAGAATAIPLLLFATAVKRISLALVGFLQYIAPTMMLLLGVFVYNEPFTNVDLIAFIFIWAALVIFTLSKTRFLSAKQKIKAA